MGILKRRVGGLKGKGKTSIHFETEAFNDHIRNVLLPRAKASSGDAVLAIALELMKLVMLRWPVDTGRSRAAWSVLSEKHGVSTMEKGGDQMAIAEGKTLGAVEEALDVPLPHIKMINGVEYSPFLEAGSSGQAPSGALRISMREIRMQTGKHVRREFKDVK